MIILRSINCDYWCLPSFEVYPETFFLRVGPRSSEPGFNWRPSTLLYGEPLNTVLYPRTGIQNKDTATTSGPMPTPQSVMLSTLIRILPVPVSTFWRPLADCFFGIRASTETLCWIPARIRSLKRARLVTESERRGIPTSRDLLVCFTGYSLSMRPCPPGVSSNPRSIIKQKSSLYSRWGDVTWYHIIRALPRKRIFSSPPNRSAIIQEGNAWPSVILN